MELENDVGDLEFESDSDEPGSDLDMATIPEDQPEDSDEVCPSFRFSFLKLTFFVY